MVFRRTLTVPLVRKTVEVWKALQTSLGVFVALAIRGKMEDLVTVSWGGEGDQRGWYYNLANVLKIQILLQE